MKKQWIIACLIGIQGVNVQAQQPSKYPYQDTKLTAEQRADDLLQRLTLEEKVALMQNNSPAIPRLGIKPYEWWNEALHGVARAGLATVFPQAIGMAASFNDELLYEVFDAVSDEARAKNRQFNEKGQYKRYQGLTMWTPNVNIFRDPRWGRGQETYGEDPYLSGRMGMAAVRGLQGPEDAEYDKLHACAKHFAVHSGPEWNRHSFNAENIAPRDLWETYLPAFKELVQKAGVKEVMCAYNRFEGDPCCGSNRLLTQILRNDWGFKGIVVTDCGAIGDFFQRKKHETHPDAAHASADAVLSGTDLECGGNFKSITDAVKKGLISEEKINTSVKRLLKARFELGEMNSTHPWSNIPFSVIDCPKHKELALKMAHESLVLLQNNNNILPLNRQMKVAVIGPNANDSVMQWYGSAIPIAMAVFTEDQKKEINQYFVDCANSVFDMMRTGADRDSYSAYLLDSNAVSAIFDVDGDDKQAAIANEANAVSRIEVLSAESVAGYPDAYIYHFSSSDSITMNIRYNAVLSSGECHRCAAVTMTYTNGSWKIAKINSTNSLFTNLTAFNPEW